VADPDAPGEFFAGALADCESFGKAILNVQMIAQTTGLSSRSRAGSDGVLVRDGLLELEDDGPLPEVAIRVPRDVLRGLLPGGSTGAASLRRAPPLETLAVEDRARERPVARRSSVATGRR
jgi:hypothetical protein